MCRVEEPDSPEDNLLVVASRTTALSHYALSQGGKVKAVKTGHSSVIIPPQEEEEKLIYNSFAFSACGGMSTNMISVSTAIYPRVGLGHIEKERIFRVATTCLTGPYWALLGLTGPYLALLSRLGHVAQI